MCCQRDENDKRMISELEQIRKNMQFFFWCALAGVLGAFAVGLILLGV